VAAETKFIGSLEDVSFPALAGALRRKSAATKHASPPMSARLMALARMMTTARW
jgi:hypothetical protein